MSDEWEDYENAKKADAERKQIALKIKQNRKKKLNRIKRTVVSVVLLGALVTGTVLSINRIGEKHNSESSMDPKETLVVAVDANNSVTEEETTKARVPYPIKSTNYTELQDDAIKSPYIAVLDVENSKVIAGRECNAKIYPASMTKVMTLILAVENLKDMNQLYMFTDDLIYPLIRQQASRAGFDPEELVTVNDILYGLILPSGADSAVAIANMVAGSEEAFADKMNQKCAELNLTNTHFVNASGLYDDQQYTTPVEMGMIMQYAMSIPECAKYLSTYQYTTAATPQHPEGILLTSTTFSRMYGTEVEGVTILAGKTGYTDEAGQCLATYAEKGGHHYVTVIAKSSYKWFPIFDNFEIYKNYTP